MNNTYDLNYALSITSFTKKEDLKIVDVSIIIKDLWINQISKSLSKYLCNIGKDAVVSLGGFLCYMCEFPLFKLATNILDSVQLSLRCVIDMWQCTSRA